MTQLLSVAAAEDVQSGLVLPVVRVQLQHQTAVAHPV